MKIVRKHRRLVLFTLSLFALVGIVVGYLRRMNILVLGAAFVTALT